MDGKNDLPLRQNGLKRIRRDGQIGGDFERCFDGGRDGFVGDIDQPVGGEDFHGGRVEIERRIERFVRNPVIDTVVDGYIISSKESFRP